MINLLIKRLNRLAYPEEMQEDLLSKISLYAKSQHFPEGSYVLKKGQICNKAFFLVKGLARSYYINQGKEVTSRLMEEGFIITSWLSFYNQQPSNEYIIAMEPCETLYLDFTDINKLYKEFSLFNIIGRKQVEYSFCQSELRTQMLRGLSAVQRYDYFCEKHDSLLRRVPLKYIASYLGMSDETISRIRSNYKKKKNLDKCQDG